jgi:hypothetical protein
MVSAALVFCQIAHRGSTPENGSLLPAPRLLEWQYPKATRYLPYKKLRHKLPDAA